MQINYTSVHFGATNMPSTLYDTLHITPTASRETIVDAYKAIHSRLATRINGIEGADQDTLDRMTRLREAFTTLSDPELRRDYDRRLAAGRLAGADAMEPARPALMKSAMLVGIIGLFVVGYAQLLGELQTIRQEQERIKTEAMLVDLELQKQREEQRLAAQADFQRRRDEAIERFLRDRAEDGAQFVESDPPANLRS